MCITFFCLYPDTSPNDNIANQNDNQKNTKLNQQSYEQNIKQSSNTNICNQKIHNNYQNIQNKDKKQINKQQNKNPKNPIKFIIGFNRDEQSQRKTIKLNNFTQDNNIIAGRDTTSNGTWLGINIKTGIMVILTNYTLSIFRHGKSRGQLVYSFLKSDFSTEDIINNPIQIDHKIQSDLKEVLEQTKTQIYPPFNLIVYNIRNDSIFYICSELSMTKPVLLEKSQVYGLCNTDLYTIWPKTQHGINIFKDILHEIQNKKDQEILEMITNKVMKDKKIFNQDKNQEASIFIQPYYNTIQNVEKMTKSTFLALIKSKQPQQNEKQQKPKLQITMRQITHADKNDKKNDNNKQNYIDDYDHKEETIVDLKFFI